MKRLTVSVVPWRAAAFAAAALVWLVLPGAAGSSPAQHNIECAHALTLPDERAFRGLREAREDA